VVAKEKIANAINSAPAVLLLVRSCVPVPSRCAFLAPNGASQPAHHENRNCLNVFYRKTFVIAEATYWWRTRAFLSRPSVNVVFFNPDGSDTHGTRCRSHLENVLPRNEMISHARSRSPFILFDEFVVHLLARSRRKESRGAPRRSKKKKNTRRNIKKPGREKEERSCAPRKQ